MVNGSLEGVDFLARHLFADGEGIAIVEEPTYDRTLKDTLAVQLDIAEQVAGVLDVVLDAVEPAARHLALLKQSADGRLPRHRPAG